MYLYFIFSSGKKLEDFELSLLLIGGPYAKTKTKR